MSANTIHRIKHGQAITTKTLDELCDILNCDFSDIIRYIKREVFLFHLYRIIGAKKGETSFSSEVSPFLESNSI